MNPSNPYGQQAYPMPIQRFVQMVPGQTQHQQLPHSGMSPLNMIPPVVSHFGPPSHSTDAPMVVPVPISTLENKKRKRSSKACVICHQRKIKCDLDTKIHGEKCTNCQDLNLECELYKRKKRIKKYQIQENLKLLMDKTNMEKMNTLKLDPQAIIEKHAVLNNQFRNNAGKRLELKAMSFTKALKFQVLKENVQFPETKFELHLIDQNDVKYLSDVGCFSLPSLELCQVYINDYFNNVHPFLPIINKKEFFESHTDLTNPPSLLLLQSILCIASKILDSPCESVEKRETHCKITSMLYKKTKLLLDFGFEKNPIKIVQALTLLSHVKNNDDTSVFWDYFHNINYNELSENDANSIKKIYWFWKSRTTYNKLFLNGNFDTYNGPELNIPPISINDFDVDKDVNVEIRQFVYESFKSIEILKFVTDKAIEADKLVCDGQSFEFIIKEMDMAIHSWFNNLPNNLKYKLNDKSTHNELAGTMTAFYYLMLTVVHFKNIVRVNELKASNLPQPDYFPSWGIIIFSTIASYCIYENFSQICLNYPLCEEFEVNHFIMLGFASCCVLEFDEFKSTQYICEPFTEMSSGIQYLTGKINSLPHYDPCIEEKLFFINRSLINESFRKFSVANFEAVKRIQVDGKTKQNFSENAKDSQSNFDAMSLIDFNFSNDINKNSQISDTINVNTNITKMEPEGNSKNGKITVNSLIINNDVLLQFRLSNHIPKLLSLIKCNWRPTFENVHKWSIKHGHSSK